MPPIVNANSNMPFISKDTLLCSIFDSFIDLKQNAYPNKEIGILIKNIQRQLQYVTISPPNTGPKARAMPPMLPNHAIALRRSFSGNNCASNEGPKGKIIAAPTPCKRRPEMSQLILGDKPAIIEAILIMAAPI